MIAATIGKGSPVIPIEDLFNSSIPADLHQLPQLKRLNLSNAGFFGQIPIQVARIRHLVSLDLSVFSTLSNVYPTLEDPDFKAFVKGLSNLEVLYLDGVNISSYQREWCDIVASAIPKLRVLSLSSCSITGPLRPSLLNLTMLSILCLDTNNLTSPVPSFLSNFSSLTLLRLRSCGLTEEFPANILRMRGLRILDLTNNPNLIIHLPEFSEESSLEELVLRGTKFSGELPSSIGKLAFLTKLELTGLNFFGQLPFSLGNLTSLVHLDLSVNNFTGRIPPLSNLKRLVKLDLSSNSLSGPIPPLANLKRLVELDLSSNNLSGAIPDIGNELLNLTEFSLHSNSINGSIPLSLFTLPSLQTLLLGQNRISGGIGNIANASLSQLTTVDLSNNDLQGPVPNSLFELSRLKVLKLSSNNFSGEVRLSWFLNLKNLSTLELSDNRFSVSVADNLSSSFPRLRTLKLGSCKLNRLPEFLIHQKQLNELDLSNNEIKGEIPEWIWQMPLNRLNLSTNSLTSLEKSPSHTTSHFLTVLDLHSNRLQGPVPLPPNSSILVDYSDNRFSSVIPDEIGSYIPDVIFFSLSRNNLHGKIPQSICNARYLKVLDLSGNNLTGSIPACLGNNDSAPLIVLNLRGNSISGVIPNNFSEGCRLKTLDVNGNQLQGQIPQSLKNCTDLEVLNLGNNVLEGGFPCWLGNLTDLRVLVLRNNRFSGSIELRGEGFKMLQIVDLSSNNFNGKLPRESFERWKAMVPNGNDNESSRAHHVIQSRVLRLTPIYYRDTVNVSSKGLEMELVKILTIFTSLDLSKNNFTGPIPDVVGTLKLLYVLNLSRNALTGPIPASLANLDQLESLDLSFNHLTGMIPGKLAQLSFLSFLNLSYNRLEGGIPQGGQFNTFSPSSFEQNLGLCGPPLPEKCHTPPSLDNGKPEKQSAQDINWQIIVVGVGFGGGIGMTIGAFMFWRKGRRWFNQKADTVYFTVFPAVVFSLLCCHDRKIEAQENSGRHLDSSSDEEESSGRLFCVFCTQLGESGTRIIHKNCSCTSSPPFSS
ncbi:receptor like protein 22-like isoform X2 [Aristolochia californica]|uniref:receptor like protein 22-like isoform X2 n=1 Tax=Aristolochia californica TaxID=171875 RepID=UPI0035E060EC